jgi:hypothetical protein
MKFISSPLLLMFFLLQSTQVFSYENSMINMQVPTNLEPRDFELNIHHRFYGPVNHQPVNTFIGMSDGSNVELGFRYLLWSKLETKAAYTFQEKEYRLGGSYALFFPELFLRTQLDGEYFNFQDFNNKRHGGGFFQLDLETVMIFDRIKPVINAAYDGYNKKPGFAFGLDLRIYDGIFLITEYYPLFAKNSQRVISNNFGSGKYNCYAIGTMIQISGHHFILQVGNSNEIGNRRLMLGTPHKQLFFGFNIERLF